MTTRSSWTRPAPFTPATSSMAIDRVTQNVIYNHESTLRLSVMTSSAKHNPKLLTVPEYTYDMLALQRLLFKVYDMMPLYSDFHRQHKKMNLSNHPELLVYNHPAFVAREFPAQHIGRITTLRLDHFFSYAIILAALDCPSSIPPYLLALAQMFTQTHTNYEMGILAPMIAREKTATLVAVTTQIERLTAILQNMGGTGLLGKYLVTGSYVLFYRGELPLDDLKKYLGEVHFQVGRLGGYVGGGGGLSATYLFTEEGELFSSQSFIRADIPDFAERVRLHHLKRKLAALTE